MFVLFFLFWIILNGRITLEITIFGIVISAAIYLFICIFMDYSPKKDLFLVKKIPLVIAYVAVLIKEIIKANITMARFIFNREIIAEPVLVHFDSDLKTRLARTVLADSITITPGTITVEMDDGSFCVHCYDKSMAEGIEESIFVRLLRRMEKNYDN